MLAMYTKSTSGYESMRQLTMSSLLAKLLVQLAAARAW